MTVDKIIICIVNVINMNDLNDYEFRGFSVSYSDDCCENVLVKLSSQLNQNTSRKERCKALAYLIDNSTKMTIFFWHKAMETSEQQKYQCFRHAKMKALLFNP